MSWIKTILRCICKYAHMKTLMTSAIGHPFLKPDLELTELGIGGSSALYWLLILTAR
jgi:hypothetical protein